MKRPSEQLNHSVFIAAILAIAATGSGTPHRTVCEKAIKADTGAKIALAIPELTEAVKPRAQETCETRKTPESTLFMGDSITVALPHLSKDFLKIDGQISMLAKGSMRTNWGVAEAKRFVSQRADKLDDIQNAVVLFGTNDIASGGPDWTAEKIHERLEEIYQILSGDVERIYAVTIPPFKGYKPFEKSYGHLNKKREAINDLIRASKTPYHVIDLCKTESEGGLASNDDPEKLIAGISYGDKLHIKKEELAKIYQRELEIGSGKQCNK